MWPVRWEFLPDRDCSAPGRTGNEGDDATLEDAAPRRGARDCPRLLGMRGCCACPGGCRAGERGSRGARDRGSARRGDRPRERAPRGARGTARRGDRTPWQRAPAAPVSEPPARGTARGTDPGSRRPAEPPVRGDGPRERASRGARGTARRGDGPRERAPGGARGVRKWRLDRRDQLRFDHTGHRCGFLRALVGLICGSRDRRRAVSPPLGFRPGQACLAFGSRSAAASDWASSASACERGGLRRFRRRFLRWSLRRPCRVSHSGSPWVGAGSEPVPYSCAGTHARRRPRTA